MGYNRKGYIIRMKNIVDITRQHYEPERQDRCYKMVWRKYINPVYGICYRTYLNYLRKANPARRKYCDRR